MNFSQFIWPWVRLLCFGLLRGTVSIVKRIAKWSEKRSLGLVVEQYRLLGILDNNMSRVSGLF